MMEIHVQTWLNTAQEGISGDSIVSLYYDAATRALRNLPDITLCMGKDLILEKTLVSISSANVEVRRANFVHAVSRPQV